MCCSHEWNIMFHIGEWKWQDEKGQISNAYTTDEYYLDREIFQAISIVPYIQRRDSRSTCTHLVQSKVSIRVDRVTELDIKISLSEAAAASDWANTGHVCRWLGATDAQVGGSVNLNRDVFELGVGHESRHTAPAAWFQGRILTMLLGYMPIHGSINNLFREPIFGT